MKTLLILLLSVCINLLIAQSIDLQWLTINGYAKTGYNAEEKVNLYEQPLSSFQENYIFGIDSIDFPVQITSFIPRNDFLLIFSDGSFYNSRYEGFGSVWPSSNSNLRKYHIKTSKEVKYLYLTNIYEEDDPPESIKINNPTTGQLLEFEGTTDNEIQLNHDFALGKDVTLIIPQNVYNQCNTNTFEVYYNSTKFQPSNIFSNGTTSSCSFYNDNNFNITPGIISGLSKFRPNHFINFRVNPNLDSSFIGDTAQFIIKCNSGTVISSIRDTIRSGHDPNAIHLKCIYRQKTKNGKNKYFAIYKAQFENKGNRVVDSVIVRLKMPNAPKLDEVYVFNYRYGKKFGRKPKSDTFVSRKVSKDIIEFKFKKGFLGASDPNTINYNLYARGFVEFLVELKEHPESVGVALLPSEATVQFDEKVQNVELMVDLNKRKEKLKKTDKRKISTKCECAPVWYKGIDCP